MGVVRAADGKAGGAGGSSSTKSVSKIQFQHISAQVKNVWAIDTGHSKKFF